MLDLFEDITALTVIIVIASIFLLAITPAFHYSTAGPLVFASIVAFFTSPFVATLAIMLGKTAYDYRS